MAIIQQNDTVVYKAANGRDGTHAQVYVAVQASAYPLGASSLSAGSGNVANASAVASLTPTATTTAYLAGFSVTGAGATAGLPVIVTVAGLLNGTRSYTYTFAVGPTAGNTPLILRFAPAIPASAINTPIVVTCPASGAGGTNNTVCAFGYQA